MYIAFLIALLIQACEQGIVPDFTRDYPELNVLLSEIKVCFLCWKEADTMGTSEDPKLTTATLQETNPYTAEDERKLKQFKVAYPLQQLGGGVEKAYISTYISYLYTNVYMMPVAFSGAITIIQTIVGWIGNPLFGIIMDKTSFKKAKYYPWLLIGPIIYYIGWLLIYSLPVFGITGMKGAYVALVIAIINALVSPMVTVPTNAVYPNLSSKPGDRQYFARMQKIMRDGGKTVFGYIFPILLPALALAFSNGAVKATAQGESISYAICAVIACVAPILGYGFYAMCLKDSYVERNAMKQKAKNKKSVPLSVMLKTLVTNRPLLGMFLFMGLHKGYYFIYIGCAVYMFKYVFNDFVKLGIFMTVFNLAAIIGVSFGPLWKSIFKETKRCFVTCMMVHVGITAIIAVVFRSLSLTGFLVLFGASSFFMGMLENYILPMFAAASDYGAWKSGQRMDGLTMSIYSLTIKTGTLISTVLRTAVLMKAGLDAITKGGEVTEMFTSTLSTFWVMGPLVLAVMSLLCLMFIVNLNDDRIKSIGEDLKAGILAKDSAHKF